MRKGTLLPTAYYEDGRWTLRERDHNPHSRQAFRTLRWPTAFPESRLVQPIAGPGDMVDFRIHDELHRGVVREVYIRGGYAAPHMPWPDALRARFLHNDRITYIVHSDGQLHRVWARHILRSHERPEPSKPKQTRRRKPSMWASLFG